MSEFEKTIAYYRESSEEDWKVAEKLFRSKDYGYSLFFCHLALEKFNIMAKKRIPQKVIKEVEKYIAILKSGKLLIKTVYVFGSYAKGNARKGSDIDVAVISPHFKSPWSALNYLYKKLPYGRGWSIEPVGFSPADFNSKYSSLINEIKTYGVEV